ncbi:unnamed protein product, partial [Effrenium voratum]
MLGPVLGAPGCARPPQAVPSPPSRAQLAEALRGGLALATAAAWRGSRGYAHSLAWRQGSAGLGQATYRRQTSLESAVHSFRHLARRPKGQRVGPKDGSAALAQRLEAFVLQGRLGPEHLRAVLVAAVYLAPRLGTQDSAAVMRLAARCGVALGEVEAESRDLAESLWALSKLRLPLPAGACTEMERRLDEAPGEMAVCDLRRFGWALAVAGRSEAQLFKRMGDELVRRQEELSAADVAGVAFAWARAGHRHRPLLRALARRVRGSRLQASGLSKVAQAAVLDEELAAELLPELAREAARKIDEFEAQDLANLLQALAQTTKADAVGEFLAAASPRCIALCPRAIPKDLCCFAWAFAVLKSPAPLPAVAQAARRALTASRGGFDARFLRCGWSGQLCWAFAAAGVDEPELFRAVADVVLPSVGCYGPRDISNLAWSFATLGYRPVGLFGTLGRRALETLQGFNCQDVATMLWAYSHVGIPAPELFFAVAANLRRWLPKFSLQELSMIAWALDGGAADTLEEEFCARLARPPLLMGHEAAAYARDLKAVLRQLRWQRLLGLAQTELQRLARAQDGAAPRLRGLGALGADDAPRIVLNLADRAVLYKPPGWEVEPTEGAEHRQLP